MSDNRNWVENQFHTDFTPDQNRALAVVGSLYRLYNLDKYLAGATVQDRWEFGYGGSLSLRFKGHMSTFDDDGLTRLVLAAHRYFVRVEIAPKSNRSMMILLSPRAEEGDLCHRHPGLADLADRASL